MIFKTRGIVLKYFKYSETSIIVKIFTEQLGLQSYIVNGIRSKKSRGKIALFQPLTLLDLIVYHKKNAGISRISETKCSEPFMSIPYEIKKSAIGIFIEEILYHSIKEGVESSEMFEFIHNSIGVLDHLESGYQNFHLQFILKLSKYLGFGLENVDVFLTSFKSDDHIQLLNTLLKSPYQNTIKIPNQTRRILLDEIVSFYIENLESLNELNSMRVLREIF